VLSGGRAWLGIGAAWNEEEALALGIPFPPVAERFERLEETLRIVHQMWAGDTRPFEGVHYRLERPLNSPPALRRPHPPILVGGGGERKTLRLVARYADACNLFDAPELPHKLAVLREHCEREGRPYEGIQKTVLSHAAEDASAEEMAETCGRLAEAGVDHVIFSQADAHESGVIERLGETAARVHRA
jgi:alkanesulfonate monooxygenase SsuD/methylene tetrahydromethanopterin reductase-like flavin-dependent oxidoreductase (luciferase family)